MDSIVKSALITAIASALVGFLGLRSSKSNSVPTLREIRYQQLCNLFEPIEKVLNRIDKSDLNDCKVEVEEIHQLLIANLKLVPSFLYREVSNLASRSHVYVYEIDKLREMNASLYNWHCKHLGYPYDSDKIVRKYAPMYHRYLVLSYLGNRLLILIILFLILSSISILDYPGTGVESFDNISIYSMVMPFTICVIGLVIAATDR